MKVLPIRINYNYNLNKEEKKAVNNVNSNKNILNNTNQIFLNFAHSLAFYGYSTNLAQSVKELNQYENVNGIEEIPPRVKSLAFDILKDGNKDDLTMIDVHKRAYYDVTLAESLDELRDSFPEFENVISINELEEPPSNGSFLKEVIEGKNKYFDNKEDLSLQLIKLYWGEGYSLKDLAAYTNIEVGKLYSAMRTLNIPRRPKLYGHILKRSDKDFSARLAESFAIKYAQRYEKEHGHIHIPRGPLTKEHREKISESLLQYYLENPDKAYLQSNRIKEFYNNNEYASEVFSLVLFEAWRLGSSKNVKKALKEFFALKRKVSSMDDNALETVLSLNNNSTEKTVLMKEFWDTHPKEKKAFSASMKSAWKSVSAIVEAEKNKEYVSIPYLPEDVAKDIMRYLEKEGKSMNDFENKFLYTKKINLLTPPIEYRKAINEYFENNEYKRTLISEIIVATAIHTYNIIKKDPQYNNDKSLREIKKITESFATRKGDIRDFSANYFFSLYMFICNELHRMNKNDILLNITSFYQYRAYEFIQLMHSKDIFK